MKTLLVFAYMSLSICSGYSFAQDRNPASLKNLLSSYYGVKNALVHSDLHGASVQSDDFLKALAAIDPTTLTDSSKKAYLLLHDELNLDAAQMSKSANVDQQRRYFSKFSVNFFKLVKAVSLTDQVIYIDYCPMKKSYWLSADAAIKNPYFGNQMLTCGKVTEMLNK